MASPRGLAPSTLLTSIRPQTSARCPGCLQPLQQVRGKKKNAKPRTTLPVRLIQDVPQWGRKGAIVPVPIGQMRNRFHPQHLAVYLPFPELASLRRSKLPLERDSAFGREFSDAAKTAARETTPAARPLRRAEPAPVQLNLLPPAEAHKLLDEVIPPTMEFFRTPIGSVEERALKTENPDAEKLGKTREAHTEAPALGESPRQTAANIYGSVGVSDVTQSIKALLLARDLGGRVVLPDEEVRFVHLGEELGAESEGSGVTSDRVKKLGEFEYEVRVKGQGGVIKRVVRVLSDDEREPAQRGPPSTGVGSQVTFGGPSAEEKAIDYA